MKYAKKIILCFLGALLLCLLFLYILTFNTGHPYHAVYYRYLSADHQLPMIEYYYPVRKMTGWSNKYDLSFVLYRENPKTNVYDRLVHWYTKNKEPRVENTAREIDLRTYIPTLGPNECPPHTLHNTNVFLSPAYRRAVEAHTKSHEEMEKSGEE